ncbi:MAG: sulfate reduction electron transfer complex DsrMKJOP subunit DsrM [Pseudomonadota bacterium]
MKVVFSFVAVVILGTVGYLASMAPPLRGFLAVVLPYLAALVFLGGLVWRVLRWARSPVPFRITTSCGQQRSLSWIKQNKLDNPSSTAGVIGRMALEILFFRSLFRNTKAHLAGGPRLSHASEKLLWLGAMAFHWSFLLVLLRHGRFFTEPVPGILGLLQDVDGVFQMGLQVVYVTNILILFGLGYLLYRRLTNPQVRYISLSADYFPLFLLLGIAVTGVCMRYWFKVDVVKVKEVALGLATLHPTAPEGVGGLFYAHLFLVCTLLVYFPFSKLVHMAGVFLSPTRNLANNNRAERHVNPWSYPVKVHAYEEWEEEFKDKIIDAGIPLDKPEHEHSNGKAASAEG